MESNGRGTAKEGPNSSRENTPRGQRIGQIAGVRVLPVDGSPSRRLRPVPPPRTGAAAPRINRNTNSNSNTNAATCGTGTSPGNTTTVPPQGRVAAVVRNLGGGDGNQGSVPDGPKMSTFGGLEGVCREFDELDAALRTMPRPRTQWYVDYDPQPTGEQADSPRDSNSNTPKAKSVDTTPQRDTRTSSTQHTPSTHHTPSATNTPNTSQTPSSPRPSISPKPTPLQKPSTPKRTTLPKQATLESPLSPTLENKVVGSPRLAPRRKPRPDTRTIAIQTEHSHTPSESTTDSPHHNGTTIRTLPTQASITAPEQAVLRQSAPHNRVNRAISIAVDSPTTHLSGTSQEKPTKIRWDLSPSPRNRTSLRREKSIKQRREEERLIKQSRLSNSYELSPDLQQKQVEMLEKRYGGRAKAQKAAQIIQQAYRKYELNKEFQRLRRTRSDSRISSYLRNFSARQPDIHSKHRNRARVMVIEDVEPTPSHVTREEKAMRKLDEVLVKETKQAISESSISPVVRPTPTERHRNNSNNVFPKSVMSPKDKVSSGGVEEPAEPGSGKKVVVTLTMTRHNSSSSTELQERGSSRSEKTIITQKDVVRVQSEEVWKPVSPQKSIPGSPPSSKSPIGSPPMSSRAVTKIITKSEKQVAMKVCIPDVSGTPPGVKGSPTGSSQSPSPVVVRASEIPSSSVCGFVVTGTKEASPNRGSESPVLGRPPKTVSVGSDVMSPVIEHRVLKKDIPRVQSPVGMPSLDKEAKHHVSHPAKHTDSAGDSRHPPRMVSNVGTQEMADRKRVGNSSPNQSIETSSLRAGHTSMGSKQEGSGDKKRESVSSSGSADTASDVNMEYVLGGRHLAGIIRADDTVSTTSTISGGSFEIVSLDRSSSSSLPAVVVASPEGSIMDFVNSSTDTDESDTEGDGRPRSHSGKRQHVASSAKRQIPKAHSTGHMDSPVWKRKNPDTRIASHSSGMLMNGSATPVRMSRSDTGDSMSSESSGSSKYTFPDDSSISESNDTLPGEIEELCAKKPLVPSLSIPMTPSRRRRYRVGINLFNKKPEKGIKFLIDNRFIEDSPHEVARFLYKRTGFSKQKIGEYLGNLQKDFNMLVLECFVEVMEFNGLTIDEALRKFQMSFLLPGEAQKIERLMEEFSKRYCYCNQEFVSRFRNMDTVFILSFAIIMLTTDLHNPNVKQERRMKLPDFIRNLSGIDDEHDLDPDMLKGIYERVKKKAFQPGEDHVTAVRKLEANISGEKPFPLAEPHRRLVSSCSLLEVNDPTKKDKKHIREVFLLNDMLLITKLYKKKTGAILGYKKKVPLQGATILEFASQHYPYGIRLVSRQDKTLASFCASHPEDRSKFLADIRECILEIEEMESLRIESELERQKLIRKSQASTSDSGVGLDTESLASTQNLSGSMDSLAPPLKEGSLKRSTLSNSLMDLKEASSKSDHRSSVSSLDSGVPIDINATMPLPKKSRSPLPTGLWGRSKKPEPTHKGPPGSPRPQQHESHA